MRGVADRWRALKKTLRSWYPSWLRSTTRAPSRQGKSTRSRFQSQNQSQPSESEPDSSLVSIAIRFGVPISVALVIIVFVCRWIFRRTALRARPGTPTYMLARLVGIPSQESRIEAAQRWYRTLDKLVARLDRPRMPGQTPLAYLRELEDLQVSWVGLVRKVTHSYV